MKIWKKTGITLCFMLMSSAVLSAITAEEIIDKMESNQNHKTSIAEGRMEIIDKYGTRVKTFKVFTQGTDKTMMEFTNIEDEGQRILRTGEDIFLYYPEAEEILAIQGSALKDRVMGSDFSYEDMTGNKDFLDRYTLTLVGEEDIDGHPCYKISVEAKKNASDVVYPKQLLWVDKELLVYRQLHSMALSGVVVKEMKVLTIKTIAGKNVPVAFEMKDAMKKNSRTLFVMENLQVDVPLDKDAFSLEVLSW